MMKKLVTFPVTFISNELISSITKVKELLALEMNELRTFNKDNKMRRQPIPLDKPLPDMPLLREYGITDFNHMISYIINFHLQLTNKSKQTLMIIPESDQIVVYFYQGAQEKAIADLEKVQTTWSNEIFPQLSKWQFISGSTKIYMQCRGYAYFKNIISFCVFKKIDILR